MSNAIPSSLPTSTMNFPSFESIFGPLLIGTLISAGLYGLTCLQAYDYYTNGNNPLHQKLVVAVLLILGTFDSAMNTHSLYYYLVKNFGNPEALLEATWSQSCRSLVIALTCFIIRTMFVRRIYLVSGKNLYFISWIMLLSTGDLIVGSMISIKSLIALNNKELQNIMHLLYIGSSFGVASDISLTVVLCWLLYSAKTGVRQTDSLVKVLMLYTVTTGLLVSIDALVGVILYIVMPNNLIFLCFFILLPKLYINAYLTSLNAREKLKRGQTDFALSLSRMSYQAGRTNITSEGMNSRHSENAMAIALETSSEPRDGQEIKTSTSYAV